MDLALKKLNLVERLLHIWDADALARVERAIESEISGAEDDLTDEEGAELDKRRAEHLAGKGRSYSREESIRLLRARSKG